MRALVTGATGFVGSNLAAALAARGTEVRVLLRASASPRALEGIGAERIVGDILDPKSLARAVEGCDVVFHVAGLSQYWRHPRKTVYEVNVQGTRNVLDAALQGRVARLVHTSSIAALGPSRSGSAADESQEYPAAMAWWAYGHSKFLAEEEVRKAVRQGLSATIVNPAIIVGPRDVNFVSGSLIRAGLRGQLRFVPPGGSAVIHVDDVVAGHLAAAERGRTGERYILSAANLSHWEMAETIAGVTGGPGPLVELPRWLLPPLAWVVDGVNALQRKPPLLNGEQVRLGGEHFYVENGKAVRELGLPQTPFRKAVQDAYDWYRAHELL